MTDGGEPLVGVYPGTFDPITNGHSDIICRAAKVLDRVVVAVAANAGKSPLFSVEERVQMIEEDMASCGVAPGQVEVVPFHGLLVNLCRDHGAGVLVRGLRAVSDFEYEFQMAVMNARQAPEIETIFFMASEKHQFISSSFVKEIGHLGGDISTLVSDRVRRHVERRVAAEKSKT
jgi:pantetheine-phosphate adenylyltransferase